MNGVEIGEEVTKLSNEISSSLIEHGIMVGNSKEDIESFCEKFIPSVMADPDSLNKFLNRLDDLKKNIKTEIDFPKFAEDMNTYFNEIEDLLATDIYYDVEKNDDAKLFKVKLDELKEKFNFASDYFDKLNKKNEAEKNCKELEKRLDEIANSNLSGNERTIQVCSVVANLDVEREKATRLDKEVSTKLNELNERLDNLDVNLYADELLDLIIDFERNCWSLTLDENVKRNIGRLIASARDTVVLLGNKKSTQDYNKECSTYGLKPTEEIKIKFVTGISEPIEAQEPEVKVEEETPTLEQIFNTGSDEVTPAVESPRIISVDELCSDLVKLNPTVKFELLYNNLTIDIDVADLKVPDYAMLEDKKLIAGGIELNIISERKEDTVNFTLVEEPIKEEEPEIQDAPDLVVEESIEKKEEHDTPEEIFTYDEEPKVIPVEEPEIAPVEVDDILDVDTLVGKLQNLNPEAKISLKQGSICSDFPVDHLVLPEGFYYDENKGLTNENNTNSDAYIAVGVVYQVGQMRRASINNYAKGAIKLGATADIIDYIKEKDKLKSTGVIASFMGTAKKLVNKLTRVGVDTTEIDIQNMDVDTEENIENAGKIGIKVKHGIMDSLMKFLMPHTYEREHEQDIDDLMKDLDEQMQNLNEAKEAGVEAINEINNQDFFGEELQGGR